jgi:hypothetical protein
MDTSRMTGDNLSKNKQEEAESEGQNFWALNKR